MARVAPLAGAHTEKCCVVQGTHLGPSGEWGAYERQPMDVSLYVNVNDVSLSLSAHRPRFPLLPLSLPLPSP